MSTYRYYLANRPPGIGTIPPYHTHIESFGTIKQAPISHRQSWGWAEYDHELTAEEVYKYELFIDRIVKPQAVHDLINFAKDEGIEEALEAAKTMREYGKPLIEYLKAIGLWKNGTGITENLRAGISSLLTS